MTTKYRALFIQFLCSFYIATCHPNRGSLRIVGGVDAPEGYAPHTVTLVISGEHRRLLCGGSILSKRHVLTAAHCVDLAVHEDGKLDSLIRGVIGPLNWRSSSNDVQFSCYKNHPQWDPKNLKYDVGILFLVEELVFSRRVAPIRLSFDWVDGGEDSFVTGWGKAGPIYEDDVWNLAPLPQTLQLLYVKTIMPQQCIEGVQDAAILHGATDETIHTKQDVEICTFHSVGHGMCTGDSGSALVSRKSGRQIGIVSWGFACALGAPDIFTRISGVKDFLISVLKNT